MNANLSAAIANQRHAELIADAEARRIATMARQAQRNHRASSRQSSSWRLRRRPLALVQTWLAAGQL